jgi:hypothetical protein
MPTINPYDARLWPLDCLGCLVQERHTQEFRHVFTCLLGPEGIEPMGHILPGGLLPLKDQVQLMHHTGAFAGRPSGVTGEADELNSADLTERPPSSMQTKPVARREAPGALVEASKGNWLVENQVPQRPIPEEESKSTTAQSKKPKPSLQST